MKQQSSKTVRVPMVDYDYVFGGACRDTLIGEKPKDYDLAYINQSTYMRAIEKLISNRYTYKLTKVLEWHNGKKVLLHRWTNKTFYNKQGKNLCTAFRDETE